MSRLLIADDDRHVRELLVYTLSEAGYELVEAKNGGEALEKAHLEHPDLILLDTWMPVMDGLQVLEKLREDSTTRTIPVILLTALAAIEGEREAMRLGVNHYLTKPWDSKTLGLTVKVALREAETLSSRARENAPVNTQGSTPSSQEIFDGPSPRTFIRTGKLLIALEKKLGGGIAEGSLTLVEGAFTTGKSVLCQHLAYGALLEDHGVAYFTSEHMGESLPSQMRSIGLSVSKYRQADKLRVYHIQEAIPGQDSGAMLATLALGIGRLAPKYDFIVLDAISHLINSSQVQPVIGFFSSCQQLCDQGRTIVVVVHSYALHDRMLRPLCDAYLRLRTEKVKGTFVRMVEVMKANEVELNEENTVSFEVVPGAGMQIIPFSQAKM